MALKTARMIAPTVAIICPDCDTAIANPFADNGSADWTGADMARAYKVLAFAACSCGTKVRLPKTITLG